MVHALTEKAVLYIFKKDKTIVITGSKGAGKDNLAGIIFYILISLGYKIWTNIHFFKEKNIQKAIERERLPYREGHIYIEKHSNIVVVNKLSITLMDMIDSGPRGKALVVNEAGIHFPGQKGMSADILTIKNLNKIIRHFGSCFILLTQLKEQLPPELRDGDVDYHFKVQLSGVNKHTLTICVKKTEIDDEGDEIKTYPPAKTFNIPLSKYPVDGDFFPGFEIDLDIKEMLDRFSEAEDSMELMDEGKGREIIKEMIEEKQEIIGYLTTGEYAKKYGISTPTVWSWCKDGKISCYKTKGGQYRVLDEEPKFKKEKQEEDMEDSDNK